MTARFALLLACFFLSGFAALLYQTAWLRELSFVFGTSELAVAAVLAAYMGGLALGAAAAARFAPGLRRPVLAYGVLELAIALCALSVPAGLAVLNGAYVGLLGGSPELVAVGTSAALFQLAGAFAVLLPPTAFMGATLPLLARHAVRSDAQIGPRVGVLYAVNTSGAIAGTLCAAFWLMPGLGLRHTVWVGAATNAAVFALAALLARGAPAGPAPRSRPTRPTVGASWILPAIALSGAVSFAYEVLWTRLLGHLLGASVHAFATMLASFLLGIALGSALAARFASSRGRAAIGFSAAELGIAITAYAAFRLADRLPELATQLGAGPETLLANAAVAGAVLLPTTLCIGATFPLAVRVLAQQPEEAARATAKVYSWNTVGAIAGALGAGFVLLPGLGFEGTLSAGVAASLSLSALAALAARPRRAWLAIVAVAVGGLLLLLQPVRAPLALLRSSPLSSRQTPGELRFLGVGRSSTVLLFDWEGSFRLSSNGLPEALIDRRGLPPLATTAHWLGLLPALVRPEARSLLVVGLGGGSVLEAVPSTFETLDVIELEPKVLEANRSIADERARDPLADPRLSVHLGDARGALRLTDERYDAIVSQPSHPWTAGASHLYTREFFSLVRSRLSPGGVFVQWIGMQFIDAELLRVLLAALVDVFPHVEVYRPDTTGVLFAASDTPIAGLAGARRALRAAPSDFARFGIHRIEDVAALLSLEEAGVRALAADAAPNSDDRNLLAARASRLGAGALDATSAQALLAPYEPFLAGHDGLDRPALIRGLMARGFGKRAEQIAETRAGPARQVALGWIALGRRRPETAARHFEQALSLGPEDGEALAGLLVTRRIELARGGVLPEPAAHGLLPLHAAVVSGWRHAESGAWDALRTLDTELGRSVPGDALFEPATRLRIRWRLEAGGPSEAAEAQTLAESLLARDWQPRDALLHARAALAAGQPLAAWGSLQRFAERLRTDRRVPPLVERALEIASGLPEERAREVRARISLLARGAAPGAAPVRNVSMP